MGIIKKVIREGKSKDNYIVEIDDKECYVINIELIYKYNIKEGKQISDELINIILCEQKLIVAKEYSLKLLKKSNKSKKYIIDRLRSKGFEEFVINEIIEFLAKYNLIDDIKFTKDFIINSLEKKNGSNKIRFNLEQRGIKEEIINEYLEKYITKEKEVSNAIELIIKRYKNFKDYDYDKEGRYLLNKGYSYEIIIEVLEKIKRVM